MGHTITQKPSHRDDLILVNSWSRGSGKYLNPDQVYKAKCQEEFSKIKSLFYITIIKKKEKLHIPIIHRLDGIAKLYGRNDPKADKTQFSISKIADFTIFQSYYSKRSFEEYKIIPVNYDVIHNAVDGNIFYPSTHLKKLPEQIKMAAISWSNNPMKGFSQLVKIAELPNIELNFIGNWNSNINSGKVNLLGVKSSKDISRSLRNSHVFVHLAENDPCPNVIIEALASGLPIIYKDSGGNAELVKGLGIAVSDNLFETINQLRHRFIELRTKIISSRAELLIDHCAKKYLKSFIKAIELIK
ncbi:glycosyltransferase [bacterium BMS3Abin03]|nr:glycosyltransferase [bacterium BMS3Abin03]